LIKDALMCGKRPLVAIHAVVSSVRRPKQDWRGEEAISSSAETGLKQSPVTPVRINQ
jgi:hypothetical protein